MHQVPQNVLDKLRIGKPGRLPSRPLLNAGKCLGIVPAQQKGWQGDDGRLRARVLSELERHYPGFRGYQIEYTFGRIG